MVPTSKTVGPPAGDSPAFALPPRVVTGSAKNAEIAGRTTSPWPSSRWPPERSITSRAPGIGPADRSAEQ
jgi:hypothetical protein